LFFIRTANGSVVTRIARLGSRCGRQETVGDGLIDEAERSVDLGLTGRGIWYWNRFIASFNGCEGERSINDGSVKDAVGCEAVEEGLELCVAFEASHSFVIVVFASIESTGFVIHDTQTRIVVLLN
jgi:hypothetical protein